MTTIKQFTISTDTLNNKVNVTELENEIKKSNITIALEDPYILLFGGTLSVYFKAELTPEEESILTNIVNIHEGNDSPVEILQVHVNEEDPVLKTGGAYLAVGLDHIVPAGNGESSTDFSFPYPIAAMDFKYTPVENMYSDRISVCLSPDTLIGNIIQNIIIGDTVIPVSHSVLQSLKPGRVLILDDGINIEKFRVALVDKVNSTIIIDKPITNDYSATTPTYVKMTIPLVDDIRLQGSGHIIEVGNEKIGGSYIPANTIIRFHYTNNEGSAKTFTGILGLLY